MAPAKDGLGLVKTLIRRVVRAFYDSRHCIVVDALLKHSTMRDDHLASIMGMQQQELRKLCGRLREDRMITMWLIKDCHEFC